MNKTPYIVAVEIGSSKIKGAAGYIDPAGTLIIKGIEEENQNPNYVRYGCIQNVKEVANELNRVITKLNNRIHPARISAVYLGIGGRSLKATPTELHMAMADDTEVTSEMVDQLLERAKVISPDMEKLAVEPVEFIVNGKNQGTDPVGLLAHELAAKVNIISCRSQITKNLQLSVSNKLNLPINGYIVRQLAMADLVLTGDEKRLGVMLVDCGAETTTVSIYKGGVLLYLATIPLGSRHITRDLTTMSLTEERADEIKRAKGDARPEESLSGSPEEVDYSRYNAVIAARTAEIVANINAQPSYAKISMEDLASGIVIVGGGSMLKGFAETLSAMTSRGVRRGSLPPMVKILGSKITTSEDLDVISLLYELAIRGNIRPCTADPQPVVKPEENDPQKTAGNSTPNDNNHDDEEDFDEEEEENGDELEVVKKRSWTSILSDAIKNLKKPAELDSFDDEN